MIINFLYLDVLNGKSCSLYMDGNRMRVREEENRRRMMAKKGILDILNLRYV